MPAPEICSDCKFFLLLQSTDQVDKGLCRYDVPHETDKHIEKFTDDSRWPTCFAQEWCGRWKPVSSSPSPSELEEWITGAGAPDAGIGKDGDLYLDTSTGNVWEKQGGNW